VTLFPSVKHRNVVIYNPSRFTTEAWIPSLWIQSKTYYEKHGEKKDSWNWVLPVTDLLADDSDRVRELLQQTPPDVFAISLYVWNSEQAHSIAQWVKETWPDCIVVSGGPHQYFKHNMNWFKEHPWLDASLPGECAGELFFQQLLDNIKDNSIDWNTVNDACYPSKTKQIKYSKQRSSNSQRKDFDYSWSAVHAQQIELEKYWQFQAEHFPNAKRLSILETTRGCPYGCTYCDWGGGINTKILSRPIEFVEQDIKALCKFDLAHIYFADANFGIFGQRDLDVITSLANQRAEHNQRFSVGYGGFAKTANKLDWIQKILQVDIDHQLSALGEVKISMQSLDPGVLKNIDRKNIDLDQQINVLQSLKGLHDTPVYVEMILGLPGMDLNKFYHELDELSQRHLSVHWYEWILLPEAPAYASSYRDQFGIQASVRNQGWHAVESSPSVKEVVVASSTFTQQDYLEMLFATSAYRMFLQGGVLKNSIAWAQDKISTGQIIRDFMHEFYFAQQQDRWVSNISRWQEILNDPTQICSFKVNNQLVFAGFYFVALAFEDFDNFVRPLAAWFQNKYQCPKDIIRSDLKLALHKNNINTTSWSKWHKLDFYKLDYPKLTNFDRVVTMTHQFKDTGSVLRAKKRWLGVFESDYSI
jgi:radical SAM superfamily enzyme YgiQ (UPF0313 family)